MNGSACVDKDWDAVARAVDERLASLDMTQTELAVRAGVAPETVRELRHNLRPRRRNPRTLAAISEALGWPPDHLGSVLAGQPAGGRAPAGPVAGELADLRAAVAQLSDRVTAIEQEMRSRP